MHRISSILKSALTLSRVNFALVVVIVLVNAYTVITPFLPQIWFWWQANHTNETAQLEKQIHEKSPSAPADNSSAGSQSTDNTNSSETSETPSGSPNKVTIPAMLLDQPIIEGNINDSDALLRKGVWRWPAGSTPDRGGNTILIAHRFSYTGPRGAFYFLNKLKPGDEIGLTWDNKNYLYKVASLVELPPTATSILDPTAQPTLTLYTCTPLWNPTDRLVVTAHLETKS